MNKHKVNRYLLAALIILFSSSSYATAEQDYTLGVAAYKAGDNTAAVEYFESALEQGMDSLSLQYNLASSYYKVGRYEDSKKYYQQLTQTTEMRDLAEYNLGLIAIEEKDGSLARQHFESVVSSGKDKKLAALSQKHLSALQQKEAKWKSNIALNYGYDSNISSVSGDSVLDQSDNFYQLFASTNYLIAGRRNNGWVVDASLFGMEYSDTDSNDEYHLTLGLKKAMKLADWNTSAKLSVAKSTYGGEDLQTITKLDLIGSKKISNKEKLYLRYQAEDIRSDRDIYDYLEGWRQRGKIEYRNFSKDNIKQIYYELELNDRGELVTLTDIYDYSPTRHTVRGKYTQLINKQWHLIGDLSYRFSDYPASATTDREDDQWKLALTSNYHIDRTLKLTAQYQYTDNASTAEQYNYDKSIVKIGLSKLF